MQLDTQGRIVGSFLIVTAYYVVLHISATIGAFMYLIANAISMPFFIRTKGYDVVIMLSFLMVISLSKLLWTKILFVTNLLIVIREQERMASNFNALNVNQCVQFITLTGQD